MKTLRIGAVLLTVAIAAACSGGGGTSIPSQDTNNGRTPAMHHAIAVPQIKSKSSTRKAQDSTGALADPGFESGSYTYWQQCGSVNARILTSRPHTGTYSDLNGQVSTPEVNGDSGLCQQVKVPAGGKITFWLYEGTNETSTTYSYQEADLLDSSGNTLKNLFTEATTTGAWVARTYDVSSYAGQTVWLYFGVHADGYSSGYIYQYVDDVAWSTSATPTPSPTASATPTHSPSPTPKPTATPTPGGGATPFPTPSGSGPHGGTCGTSCGVERWHIKTLDDGDEHLIKWTPASASVTTLRNVAVPAGWTSSNDTTRYAPYEEQLYTVRAVLVGWKTETDHDFHMVIADPNNTSNTMIVEPPDPTCNDACDSGFTNIFSATRTKLTNCLGTPPSSFKNFTTTIVADFTGMPFFDALHGQTGVAPNGIELHPLLNVTFVSGAPGC